jgi:hypothetical protein
MPVDHIVALLIAERDRLTRAIEALQGPVKRRGRPPRNAMQATDSDSTSAAAPKKKRGRTFSAAQRRAAAERMKAMWAKRRKAAKA